MKILDNVKSTLFNLKKSFERFPVSIIISTIFTVILIYTIENLSDFSYDTRDNLTRLNMVLGLGIPMSIFIALLGERFSKKVGIIGYVLGGAFLVLYYSYLLPEFDMVPMTRYIGTIIFFIILCFYSLKIGLDQNYEVFVIKVFSGIFITILYAGVLYFGLAAILFTIENLFEVDFIDNIYIYIWFIVVFVFGVSLFLSKVPDKDEDFKSYEYSKSLRVLLLYIVIPLITVYTIILYAYFIKILATWEWPKGLVSHLVLWYSSVSVGVIFLLTPILDDSKVANKFKFLFPKFILPILLMMFASIGQRINQYGITENRYYVVVLGIWVFCIMLYFSIKKPLKNTIIPISLSVVVLLSIFGHLSSYSISMLSQNKELERLLEENNILVNGVLVANQDVDKDMQNEISNKISYFSSYHDLDDIRVFPEDYDLDDTKDLLGFNFNPIFRDINNNMYFSYYLDLYDSPIEITDYEYSINISSWRDEFRSIEGMRIKVDREDFILAISEEGNELIAVDLNELAERIHMKSFDQEQYKTVESVEEMTFDVANENIGLRIIVTNISGYINDDDRGLQLESAEFILLIDMD